MEFKEKLKLYRLSEQEYNKICDQLGRPPEGVEWALFSSLWSEHCSYKTSRIHLKKFYSKSDRVLEAFGENAGVIDLGEGERVAFKMESHNHPSFIEPYQGAATGVGGILRDIFTMGARPIALANYLCFGEPKASRMQSLVDGVVRGISGYGNCVGVPTVTGQTEFHSSYNGNILVNALALGLFRPGMRVVTSGASGPGNYVVYVGAKTGRDGVHGASMASESFDEDSESKKPTIQIGDPFFEKLLIESCLEVMEQDLVVAIQDMGAAGLTSSSFEMASKGNVGLTLHLDKVPLRDSSITPEEILLSESQERMLLICEPAKFDALKKVFERWDLDAQVVGEVKEERVVELYWKGEQLCALDPYLLTEEAPIYERPYEKWQPKHRVADSESWMSPVADASKTLLRILKDVRGTSREWIYRQYDQRVGGATVRDSRDSVAVVRLPDTGRGLGLVLGCRPHVMRLDAAEGAKDAILYPSLELAAKGFEPLAATDCLNFGNPEKPALMSEFVASVENMSAACEAVNTPVISGNVSFYNETLNENVTSTPSTGLVGLRDSIHEIPESHFTQEGDHLVLLRFEQLKMNGMIAEINNQELKAVGELDSPKAAKFIELVRKVSGLTGVRSSRVVGKLGLGYALARMSTEELGCVVESGEWFEEDEASSLFAERAYEVIFALDISSLQQLQELVAQSGMTEEGLQVWSFGEVKKGTFQIGHSINVSLNDIRGPYQKGWEAEFEALA